MSNWSVEWEDSVQATVGFMPPVKLPTLLSLKMIDQALVASLINIDLEGSKLVKPRSSLQVFLQKIVAANYYRFCYFINES